jgi:hypothetical protein
VHPNTDMSSVTVEQAQPGPHAPASMGSQPRKHVLRVGLPTPQTSPDPHAPGSTGLQTLAHQKTARPRDILRLQCSPSPQGVSRQSPWASTRH